MQKWLLGFVVLLILSIAGTYIFIPDNFKISEVNIVKCSIQGAFRVVSSERYWEKQQTANSAQNQDVNNSTCDKYTFRVIEKTYNAVIIKARHGSQDFLTKLILLQLNPDSIVLKWETSVDASLNPVKRILQYNQALGCKRCFSHYLDNIKKFLEDPVNVYGYDIKRTTLTDSVLVSIKSASKHYPTITEVYNSIKKLRNYISSEGAIATNFPMLHIARNRDSSYSSMVAIATNKALYGNGEIALKRLAIIPNKILTTEIKGGFNAVNNAFSAIERYMADYNLTAPVIPFQLLLTDRSKEPDTTKWVTRIYYPII